MWKGDKVRIDNPFDKKLGAYKDTISEEIRDAAIYVTDTLDLCWASAQAVYEDKATPELALQIYDRVIERIEFMHHAETDR